MVTEAWRALGSNNWNHAIDQAEATIQEWASVATYLQQKKMQEVGQLHDVAVGVEECATSGIRHVVDSTYDRRDGRSASRSTRG